MSEARAAVSPPKFIASGLVPTAEQQRIQLSRSRITLVEANAGAAKTTTLALRIGEALARGLPPERILGLVFTPEARDVLAARLVQIGIAPVLAARVRVVTLEAHAAQVLATLEDGTPESLDSMQALKPCVLEAIERVSEDYAGHPALDIQTHHLAISQFLAQQLQLKATLRWRERDDEDGGDLESQAEDLGLTLSTYLTLREYEALRIDAMGEAGFRGPLDACYDLATRLRAAPELAAHLPPYTLVVADELHDVNEAAFQILAAQLSLPNTYFVGAGDRDQVIHGDRGADAQFLAFRFAELDAQATRLPLTMTYRHGPHLAYAMQAYKQKPVESNLPLRTDIDVRHYDGAPACAQAVVAALADWTGRKRALEGCAILLRERHQSIEIENALMRAQIGYRTLGMTPYLHREEIYFLRGMLALALRNLEAVNSQAAVHAIIDALATFGEVPLDADALQQAKATIAATPSALQYFFEGQIQAAGNVATRTRMLETVGHLETLGPDAPAHQALSDICARMDIDRLARRLYVDQHDAAILTRSIAGFIDMARQMGLGTLAFSTWLNQADAQLGSRRVKRLVVLDCIAQSKGTEFDHVILPFIEQHEFPLRGRPAAEEDNLFYVGATRSRERLTLLAPADAAARSPYLARLALSETRERADAALARNARLPAAAAPTPGALPGGRQNLAVSYAQKNDAKALGAKWDDATKVWYVPPGVDLAPFEQWLPKR